MIVSSDGFWDTEFILEINIVKRKLRAIKKGWKKAPHKILTEKRKQSEILASLLTLTIGCQ